MDEELNQLRAQVLPRDISNGTEGREYEDVADGIIVLNVGHPSMRAFTAVDGGPVSASL